MLSFLSFIAALCALLLSLVAYRRTRAGAAGAHTQTSSLEAQVVDAHARRELAGDTREYALLLSLRNDTSAVAGITQIALRVTYRTRANFLGAVDLDPVAAAPDDSSHQPQLTLPLQLAAQPASGWLFFKTANVIPRHCRVHDYALVLRMTDDRRLLVDASLPSLLASDSDGNGPRTWGWD